MSGTLLAQEAKEAKVTELLSKDLTNLPGKEGLMITVEYPPGGSHSLGDTSKEQLNADLLAFIKG